MKLILTILLTLISVIGFSQVTPFKRSSPAILAQDARVQDYLNLVMPVVLDTTNALNGGLDSLGLIVYNKADATVYYRDTTPGGHKWSAFGKGGICGDQTWQQTLDVPNGSILTQDNIITVGSTLLDFTTTGLSGGAFAIVDAGGRTVVGMGDMGMVANLSRVVVTDQDSLIELKAHHIQMTLDSVNTPQNIVWKDNNDSLHIAALPAGSTPTWQQTLITGSTLTQNNTIIGGGFSYTWGGLNNFTLGTTNLDTFKIDNTNQKMLWNKRFVQIDTLNYKFPTKHIATLAAYPSIDGSANDVRVLSDTSGDGTLVWKLLPYYVNPTFARTYFGTGGTGGARHPLTVSSITAFGYNVLSAANNSANNNTAFGVNIASSATSAANIDGFGVNNLFNLTTGVNNTSFGTYSLNGVTTQSNNVAVGAGALGTDVNNGSRNQTGIVATNTIALGTNAGNGAVTGNWTSTTTATNSIFIGKNNGIATIGNTVDSTTVIGNLMKTSLSNIFVLGGATQKVIIPNNTLSVTVDNGTKLQTPSFATGLVQKTANYTLTAFDHTAEATSGTFTFTLPSSTSIGGREYYIINSGAGTVTLATTSSQTFSNVSGTPTSLNLAGVGTLLVQSNGGGWVVTASAGSGVIVSGGGGGTGTVTSVAQSFTGGLISVSGSPITTAGTLALTVAGTSGGIPYFSGSSTWASSAALAANAIVIGGGAGVAPSTTTTGTGVLTALGVNTGSAGSFVVNGGALGTPSSGTLTNATGLPESGVTNLVSDLALKAPLASPTFTGTVTIPTPFTLGATSVTSTGTQLNYLNAATGTTGTASTNLVFSTSPNLTTPTFTTSATMADAANIILNTSTGTKIGTGTSQKLGFYNATPVVQQSGSVVTGLNNLGLFTGATISASDVTLANLTATDATLTFSGTYNGSAARTIGLNLSNANTWAAVQTFSTPVINGLATGTGVDANATASTIVTRDANGNINANSFNHGYTTTVTAAGTTTLTVGSTNLQYFTGSTTQTVTMPVTSTLVLGQRYLIINNSTGAVTVNSSGSNAITILAASTSATFTCILTSGTTAASWNSKYLGGIYTSGKSASFSNSITFAGTDATTMTFPSTSATIARTDAAQTFSGVQNYTGSVIMNTASTGSYRTTNGGSNISGLWIVDIGSSSVTAGSLGIATDNTTGGLVFTAANGTRRIVRGQIGITNLVNTAGSETGDLSFYTQSAGTAVTEKLRITSVGGLVINATNTTAGTTGNQTINKPSGTVNIAAGGTTVTVTNALVTTASLVFAVIRTNDATATLKNAVPGSGSFVITLTAAATAEVSIGFFVVN